MSKSIKLTENTYWDSTSITHNETSLSEVLTTTSVTLSLTTGWSEPYASDSAKAIKYGNVVCLQGLLNGTSSAGTTIATLPAGYRPAGRYNRFWAVYGSGHDLYADIQINRDGTIEFLSKSTSATVTFLSLSSICFIAEN